MDISVLRNLVIRYGAKLNLKPNEQVCLWHLLDHDFTGKGYVFPSESTIAKRMGIKSNRQISRIIQSLNKKGYISIKIIEGFSNRYTFKGIVRAAIPFLKEEMGRNKKRLISTPDKNVRGSHPRQKCHDPQTKMSGESRQKCQETPDKNVLLSTAIEHCNRTLQKNTGKETPKTPPQISSSSANNDQKQIPTRHTSEWDMWKIEQGEPTYEKYFNRRPYFNGKDLNEFCRLRGDGATVAQITECYEEFCRTENAYYAKRGYAFHVFAEDFNAFGNEKMKSIIEKDARSNAKGKGSTKPNVVVEDLGELTLKRFGLA